MYHDETNDKTYDVTLTKVDVSCGPWGMYNFYKIQVRRLQLGHVWVCSVSVEGTFVTGQIQLLVLMVFLSEFIWSQMFHKDLLAKCKKKELSEMMGWLVNLFLVLCSTDGATKCHKLVTGCLSQTNYVVSGMQIMWLKATGLCMFISNKLCCKCDTDYMTKSHRLLRIWPK